MLSTLCVVASASLKSSPIQKVVNDSIFSLHQDSLISFYNDIARQSSDKGRTKANDRFTAYLNSIINDEYFLEFPFDSLSKQIYLCDAPDKTFRIINWAVASFKGTYEYHGYIVRKNSDSSSVFILSDSSSQIQNPEFSFTSYKNWFGALYYDLVKSGDKAEPYYVLLGWDGNDLFTNKKVIDVLWFDESGTPHFGKPIFHIKNNKKTRLIFEYTDNSAMRLRWDDKIKMIVFDHLSPANDRYRNHPEYYGSDFSFDGLAYEKGKWLLVEDLDVRNPKLKKKEK